MVGRSTHYFNGLYARRSILQWAALCEEAYLDVGYLVASEPERREALWDNRESSKHGDKQIYI